MNINNPKAIVLSVLVIQTSIFHLVLRFSRSESATPYNAVAAVAYTEIIKLIASVAVLAYRHGGLVDALRSFIETTSSHRRTTLMLIIPALLYTAQNTMVIYAISNLSAAQFSVARQVKIPITGFFSVALLRKELGIRKWCAIFAVATGVAIVQLAKSTQDSYRVLSNDENSTHFQDKILGLVYAFSSCITSGLASVWFEMLLKGEKVDLWIMNVQLALFSIVIAVLSVLYSADLSAFTNFDKMGFLSVTFSASDGLVIAFVMKYADNILKGFATSIAICLTATASVVLGDMPFSYELLFGCAIVIVAVIVYGGGLELLDISRRTLDIRPLGKARLESIEVPNP